MINAIPGCADISMYPMILAASDMPMRLVIDCLVRQAFARHAEVDLLGG